MAKFVCDMDVQTVGELKTLLDTLPDEMPVYDAMGELLCVRVFEEAGEKFLEMA